MNEPTTDKTSLTDDERIDNIVPLPPPEHLIRFFPIQGSAAEGLIAETRARVRQILHGRSDRLLVVIGPCSIHDPLAALEYAKKLKEQRTRLAGELEVLMRVYFEKPRTTVGWKGLINDPYLNGSFRINEGLRIARDLLVRINQAGCLDRCEEGPCIVVYPDAVWYTYVDQADIDEIIEEHLRHGRVVERLRM